MSSNDAFEREITREHPKATSIGFDSMLEDIFGMNLRGLRTLVASLTKSSEYADAARSRDWLGGRYTPSFRVGFTLMAIFGLISLFFTHEIFPGYENVVFGDDDTTPLPGLGADGPTEADITRSMLGFVATYAGLALIPVVLLLAAIYRAFPFPTTFVLRFRLVLVMILPVTTITVMTSLLELLPRESEWTLWDIVGLTASVIALWAYPLLGPLAGYRLGKRIAFTTVFSALFVACFLFAVFALMLIGMFFVEDGALIQSFIAEPVAVEATSE